MKITHLITLAIVGAAFASPAMAQDPSHGKAVSAVATTNGKRAKKENLKAEAKISRDSARTVALSKVAVDSKVTSSKLERENGTVVYAIDIKVPKQAGREEILVNAVDGTVVSQKHETPKQEKAEKKAEKKG